MTNTGVIIADGGTVQLTARAADGIVQNLVQAGGTIRAATMGGQTGTVALNGVGGSIVVEGQLAAPGTAPGTKGGTIVANATGTVTLPPTAMLNASGRAGGGTVAVGTTLARATGGPGVTPTLTAANVMVQKGATIAADATGKGKGGRVTVLSTGTTAMAGAISAKGGPKGGDGGFVETSGQGVLTIGPDGSVSAAAPKGKPGTWLLDPDSNVTITTATSNAACTGTPAVCLPSADSSTLAANTIIAALNAGTSVTVQTTNPAGTEAGNILVGSGPVDGTISGFNAPSAVTLTLNAGSGGGAGGITVNSPISDSGSTGALSVVLTAGGDITLDNSVTIGATLIATAGPAAAVNINSGGAIAAAGGLALAAGSGGISLVDNVTASGETVTLSSAGAISQTGGVITAGNLAITAAGSVGLPAANSVTTLAASVTGSGNGIIFRDASTPLSVGTVGSVAGISTSDGRIAMSTTTSGNVTVKSAITSTGGEIDIATAPGSGFINSAAIGSGGGNIVLLGDTLALAGAGATVNAGTGAVVLGPATTTRNIVLGAASNGTTLGLQSTDFATITAGMVEVGYRAEDATASFTGDISVGGGAGISLNPTGFPALLLVTGGPGGTVKQTQSVNFTGPRGTLGVIAGGKVSLTLSNAVDTLAGFADNSSAFAFSNSHALAARGLADAAARHFGRPHHGARQLGGDGDGGRQAEQSADRGHGICAGGADHDDGRPDAGGRGDGER